jgi:hypothetical protein
MQTMQPVMNAQHHQQPTANVAQKVLRRAEVAKVRFDRGDQKVQSSYEPELIVIVSGGPQPARLPRPRQLQGPEWMARPHSQSN